MGSLTLGDIISWVKDLGTLGVLILILWWGNDGRWVWGWQRDREVTACKQSCDEKVERERSIANEYREDRDQWKKTAIDLLQLGRVTTGALAERKVTDD